MKKIILLLSAILLIASNTLESYAQKTSITIDNQNPGWLSNNIVYKDQVSVKNLTVTGYINGTDIKFIRDLVINRSLRHIDLTNANIVAGGTAYYSNYYTDDDVVGSYMFNLANLTYLSLPISVKKVYCSDIHADSIIIGGNPNLKSVSYIKKVKYLYIREGVETIDDLENIKFLHIPSTVTKLGANAVNNYYAFDSEEERATKDMTVEFSDSITDMDKYAFRYTKLTNDTIKLPEKLKTWYVEAFKVKDNAVIIIPKGLTYIDLLVRMVSGSSDVYSDNISYTPLEFYVKSQTPININYHYSDKILEKATVHIPIGTTEAYKASKIWSHANLIEDKIAVTGIELDKDCINFSKVGDTETLTATILPKDATNQNFTWHTSNPNIALVNNGKVVCTGIGSAVIYALTEEGNFMATCTINTTTGINGITTNGKNESTIYYDLEGRKIQTPIKGHLYINNKRQKVVF